MEIFQRKELRTLATAALFAGGLAILLRSWELVVMIVVALAVHELGHVFALWRYGVESEVGFSPAGAYTKSPLYHRRALDQFTNCLIHLAGPLFSLFWAILSMGIDLTLNQSAEHGFWSRMANLSAMLALLNILPMGNVTDGGRTIKRIFASLQEEAEGQVIRFITVWAGSVVWIILITRRDPLHILAVGLLLAYFLLQLLLERGRDDPADAESPKAMTDRQAIFLLGAMLTMLLASTVITVRTPLWLTQGQTRHMLSAWNTTLQRLGDQGPLALWIGLGLIALLSVALITRFVRQQAKKARTGEERATDVQKH